MAGAPGGTERQSQALREWLHDLMEELAEDSSGDWGEERDPVGVGWERACKHYAEQIKNKLSEVPS